MFSSLGPDPSCCVLAQASQSSRLRSSIFRHESRFSGMRCPIVPLSGLILGGADLHRPVERQIAAHPPAGEFRPRSAGSSRFRAPWTAEDLPGDLDLLGERDFLLAGEQRDLAHLGEVHAHRIVDPLGAGLGQVRPRGSCRSLPHPVVVLDQRRPRPAAVRRAAAPFSWPCRLARPLVEFGDVASSMSRMPISSIGQVPAAGAQVLDRLHPQVDLGLRPRPDQGRFHDGNGTTTGDGRRGDGDGGVGVILHATFKTPTRAATKGDTGPTCDPQGKAVRAKVLRGVPEPCNGGGRRPWYSVVLPKRRELGVENRELQKTGGTLQLPILDSSSRLPHFSCPPAASPAGGTFLELS